VIVRTFTENFKQIRSTTNRTCRLVSRPVTGTSGSTRSELAFEPPLNFESLVVCCLVSLSTFEQFEEKGATVVSDANAVMQWDEVLL